MSRALIDLDDARETVLRSAARVSAEDVELADAGGRVLAEDVSSPEAVPGADNSAMDGFAVRSADLAGAGPERPVRLRIAGESRAGRPAEAALGPGEAFRISTGAVVPEGADAVVRVEETEEAGGEVEIAAAPEPGRDIRRAGEDIAPGDVVLRAGTAIGAVELGVLASVGRGAVRCARRPRLALLGTGDELLDPTEPMRPGGVRDTNGWALAELARRSGAEVSSRERTGDDPDATRDAVGRALAADVCVVCGGVSVGEHDHVRGALADHGAEQVFWGVALRPGRPTWFGLRDGGPVEGGGLAFGLPGNPVSAIVTFLLFVRPALRALSGGSPDRDRTLATLDTAYEKGAGRSHAVRVRLRLGEDGWHAEPTRGAQGSHVLTSMLGADALAIIPASTSTVAAGEQVAVELLPRV